MARWHSYRADGRIWAVLIGFQGKIACVMRWENKTEADRAAARVRGEYPDPRAEIWVTRSGFHETAKWRDIEPKLRRDGPPPPVFQQASRQLLDHRIRSMISTAIQKNRQGKPVFSEFGRVLSYSIDELMRHLEARFVEGMSWDNYGDWHIDHVVPLRAFHDDDYIRFGWSLRNLQPLWAIDNIMKAFDDQRAYPGELERDGWVG